MVEEGNREHGCKGGCIDKKVEVVVVIIAIISQFVRPLLPHDHDLLHQAS